MGVLPRNIFVAIAFVLISPASGAAACAPADFEIVGLNFTARDDCRLTPCPVYVVTGELVNNCATEAGAQLKATTWNAAGQVVETYEGWPASTRNLAPGARYPFDIGPGLRWNESASRITVDIIDARTW